MVRLSRTALAPLALAACTIAVAACGSSNNKTTSGSRSSTPAGLSLSGLASTKPNPSAQHMGGTLNVISAEGWEHLDPQASYFQIDYLVVYATQTPLDRKSTRLNSSHV